MKRIQALILGMVLVLSCLHAPLRVLGEEEQEEQQSEQAVQEEAQAEVAVSAPSAGLMEAATGRGIF